jgi:hypothetical protein
LILALAFVVVALITRTLIVQFLCALFVLPLCSLLWLAFGVWAMHGIDSLLFGGHLEIFGPIRVAVGKDICWLVKIRTEAIV